MAAAAPQAPVASRASPAANARSREARLKRLVGEIRACRVCAAQLPFGPNPILSVGKGTAPILLIGQAPGTKVHATGVPWNDPSGDRLRDWLGVSREAFYDTRNFAIFPMGFCYPGRGRSGDLPPRRECAPLWHDKLLKLLPNLRLIVLIGAYAQARYLKDKSKAGLTETVRAWRDYVEEGYVPLVHPSPRNVGWFKKNPWFEREIVPFLKERKRTLLPDL